jgi:hypothetical protein
MAPTDQPQLIQIGENSKRRIGQLVPSFTAVLHSIFLGILLKKFKKQKLRL